MDLMALARRLDLDRIVSEFMEKLKVGPFDMFFVVCKDPGSEEYEVLGLAYSLRAAREIKKEHAAVDPQIFCFDLGKIVKLVEGLGAAKEVG